MARTAATSLINHPGTVAEDSFLTTLAEGLVLSGLAMAVAGTSRPCSGACHETSHSIDSLFPDKSAPHGEQVALGALFATHVRGAKRDFVQLLAVMRRHGLPVSPIELGLSIEEFAQAIFHAPQTRPDRFTILEHLDMSRQQCDAAVAEFMYAL
jgi:glycerol-1-phosphate dehydrogenase [NAD(P)+]